MSCVLSYAGFKLKSRGEGGLKEDFWVWLGPSLKILTHIELQKLDITERLFSITWHLGWDDGYYKMLGILYGIH